jgi:hypothetical protein
MGQSGVFLLRHVRLDRSKNEKLAFSSANCDSDLFKKSVLKTINTSIMLTHLRLQAYAFVKDSLIMSIGDKIFGKLTSLELISSKLISKQSLNHVATSCSKLVAFVYSASEPVAADNGKSL